jgi:NIMA (never in mitosis gene a)-related kinase
MKKLQNYTPSKPLKKGTTGNISLYFSDSDSKKVAIKEIDISDLNDQKINELKKEGELLKSVNHPNIIQFYESFIEDKNFYIVMEYCEKNDLNSYINSYKNKNEKIPEDFIWKVAFQVLDALHYLHNERKIVHKDIKPLNLLIDKDDNIKICDFGSSGMVSILTKIKTSLRLTNKNYTPVCRPPEDIFKFQSDIWSLGVTLYYMAEMVYPFGEESEKDIKDNILNKIPKEINEYYTRELNNFIMKMLIKDYLKRPSAKECIDMIPREIKKKVNPNYKINNNFLIRFFFGSNIPIEIEYKPEEREEIFYDLYSIVSEFRNDRNFICPKCKKIPKININYIELSASFQCECGYFILPNIIDFYRIFTEQRNQQKPGICTNCQRKHEFYELISKNPQKYKELNYKYCCECKKVLCLECREEHDKCNPKHSLMDDLIEFNSNCINHKKKLSHFCKDCFINLCEECKNAHNKDYIGHYIKENKKIDIDEKMIEDAKSNIETIYESIKKCEKYILENKKIIQINLIYY